MTSEEERLERLAILANILQVGSFIMNEQQLTNDDIMKAIDLQNKNYLEEILSNQKIILERLDKLEKK